MSVLLIQTVWLWDGEVSVLLTTNCMVMEGRGQSTVLRPVFCLSNFCLCVWLNACLLGFGRPFGLSRNLLKY